MIRKRPRRVDWRGISSPSLSEWEVAKRLHETAKRTAKKRGLTFDLPFGEVLKQVKRGFCPLSGIPFDHRAKPPGNFDLPFRASLDRLDNTRGYEAGNVLVVAKICNHAKWTWDQDDLVRMAKGIAKRFP